MVSPPDPGLCGENDFCPEIDPEFFKFRSDHPRAAALNRYNGSIVVDLISSMLSSAVTL